MSELRKVYEQRRSVNFFDKKKPLSDTKLREIIELASLAPSAFNLQPWDVIAVKSEQNKKKLYPLALNQDKILEAPVTLIIIGNRNGYSKANKAWIDLQVVLASKEAVENSQNFAESLYGSSEERKIKFAESNTGLFCMSIMYAAKSLGVDSHPLSGIDFAGIKETFSIPDEKEVVMLICLGYFDESKTLHGRMERKKYHEMVKEI